MPCETAAHAWRCAASNCETEARCKRAKVPLLPLYVTLFEKPRPNMSGIATGVMALLLGSIEAPIKAYSQPARASEVT